MFAFFDDIVTTEDFDFDNILLDEKSYENLTFQKKWMFSKKADGLIRGYDNTKYLVFYGSGKHDAIYNRIRYFTGLKSGITYVLFHNFSKFKKEKIFTLQNVAIIIKLTKIKITSTIINYLENFCINQLKNNNKKLLIV